MVEETELRATFSWFANRPQLNKPDFCAVHWSSAAASYSPSPHLLTKAAVPYGPLPRDQRHTWGFRRHLHIRSVCSLSARHCGGQDCVKRLFFRSEKSHQRLGQPGRNHLCSGGSVALGRSDAQRHGGKAKTGKRLDKTALCQFNPN